MSATTSSATIIENDPALVGAWMGAHGVPWRDGATCIGLVRHGQLIGGVMYDWYTGTSICAHIVMTGQPTRDWLRFIVWYPFVQLQCKVVVGIVAEGNHKSRRFVEHFGFTLQTRIEEADPSGALLIYTLRPDHCRWLRRPLHG